MATKPAVPVIKITDEQIRAGFDSVYARTNKLPRPVEVQREMGLKSALGGRMVEMAITYWAERGQHYKTKATMWTEEQVINACDAVFARTKSAPRPTEIRIEAGIRTSNTNAINKIITKWSNARGINIRRHTVTKVAVHAACQQLYLQTGVQPIPKDVWRQLGEFGDKGRIKLLMEDWVPTAGEGPLAGYTVDQVQSLLWNRHREHRQILTTAELIATMGGGDADEVGKLRRTWLSANERKFIKGIDPEMKCFEDVDTRLAEWREAIREWMAYRNFVDNGDSSRGKTSRAARLYMGQFLFDYILMNELPFWIDDFLSKSFVAPEFSQFFPTNVPSVVRQKYINATDMIDLLLGTRHSTFDERGYPVIDPLYHNPIPPLPEKFGGKRKSKNLVVAAHRIRGVTHDKDLSWMTEVDPRFEQWQKLASAWIKTLHIAIGPPLGALRGLFVDYMWALKMPLEPAEFLRRGVIADPPSLHEIAFSGLSKKGNVRACFRFVNSFIDYVLLNYFSAEDDEGVRRVLPEYHNPIPLLDPVAFSGLGDGGAESDKNVLPSMYVRMLREFLIPTDAKHFSDLTWAHDAIPRGSGSMGDWYQVDEQDINRDDSDCVWRYRETTRYERMNLHMPDSVYEMWSPVRVMALMVKLELPLRNFQVRVLDSGEADDWRYENGKWLENAGPLAGMRQGRPDLGVFRRIQDPLTHAVFTGLYINTNKTADRLKDPNSFGYEVPWSHDKVLYWLSKLRDWQERYNPISKPTPWSSLKKRHLGHAKADSQIALLGTTCFLFRDPVDEVRDAPISGGMLNVLWRKLLMRLEKHVEEQGMRGLDGSKILFVPPFSSGDTTYYPLHSLRVTLISHYALEGGVSMNVLSKCIAGHARVVMTLYYTKAGVTYVSEMMDEAGKKILEAEQRNYIQWLRDASIKQIQNSSVTMDMVAITAVKGALATHNGVVRFDKGLCPKGGMGCVDGGVVVNEETGSITYGAVPGYPMERNCTRCRWFVTGPAFLLGLHQHWNQIQLALGDSGQRYQESEREVERLEEAQYACEMIGTLFTEDDKLASARKASEDAFMRNEKLAADSLATLRLIARCQALVENSKVAGSEIDLVAVGGIKDIKVVMEECSELQQVLIVASSAALFVEEDTSKAVLKAGRAFDMMLHRNNKQPVFFKPSERDLPVVVRHMTRLLQAQAGSIRDAVPFIEGVKPLNELGYDISGEEVLSLASAGTPIQWQANTRTIGRSRVLTLTD